LFGTVNSSGGFQDLRGPLLVSTDTVITAVFLSTVTWTTAPVGIAVLLVCLVGGITKMVKRGVFATVGMLIWIPLTGKRRGIGWFLVMVQLWQLESPFAGGGAAAKAGAESLCSVPDEATMLTAMKTLASSARHRFGAITSLSLLSMPC